MISKKTVLTSAQCIHNFDFEQNWYVSPLVADLNGLNNMIMRYEELGVLVNVELIHIHEEFSLSSLRNDLAALTTTKDLLTNKNKKYYDSIDVYRGDLTREYEKDDGIFCLLSYLNTA